jgi:predicted ATP-grasp superfamily ATP-dependent carboligase
MYVIVIGNDNPGSKYYSDVIPSIIKKINLIPIFMYDIDFNCYEKSNYYETTNINLSYIKSMYEKIIIYSNKELGKAINELKKFYITAIIPDGEDSVIDAEYFSHHFNTLSNPIGTSNCRRYKYDMQERIKNNGLVGINQKKCYTVNDIKIFVRENPNTNYVIKPDKGAATENVFLCEDINSLIDKYNIIINSNYNHVNLKNKCCIVQEYIDGEEWNINTVSRNGKHKIINVMKYKKDNVNGRHFTYLQSELVEPQNVPDELLTYTKQVLNALEIQTGAGHTEIKMSSKGPCLIEIGARVGGGQYRLYISKCLSKTYKGDNYDQQIASIYAYCDGRLFETIPNMYKLINNGSTIYCNSKYDNIVWKKVYMDALLNDISKLVYVENIKYMYEEDEPIKKTIDFYTDLLYFDVISENNENINKATIIIREWEKNLYLIAKKHNGIINPLFYYFKLFVSIIAILLLLFFIIRNRYRVNIKTIRKIKNAIK